MDVTNDAKDLGPSATLVTTWREQSKWSIAANRAKRSYATWRSVAFSLTIAAAATATLANDVGAQHSVVRRWVSFGGACLAALLAIVGQWKVSPDRLRAWMRARAASEALKTEVYLFVTRTHPYDTEADVHALLSDRVARVTDAVKDLGSSVADVVAVERDPPVERMPVATYLNERVDGPVARYYRAKANMEIVLVKRYRAAQFVLAIVGAALGAWAAAADSTRFAPWGAVVTTAIGALAAQLAAGRHEYQVTALTSTALQLERLASRFRDAHRAQLPTKQDIDALVAECEAAITAENQAWMTQWEKPTA